MPKVGEPTREPSREELELFRFRGGFRRSRRGNLWRNFEGMTLTVFKRQGDGWFGWCIADEGGTRYSEGGYETEGEAIEGLFGALGGWGES